MQCRVIALWQPISDTCSADGAGCSTNLGAQSKNITWCRGHLQDLGRPQMLLLVVSLQSFAVCGLVLLAWHAPVCDHATEQCMLTPCRSVMRLLTAADELEKWIQLEAKSEARGSWFDQPAPRCGDDGTWFYTNVYGCRTLYQAQQRWPRHVQPHLRM